MNFNKLRRFCYFFNLRSQQNLSFSIKIEFSVIYTKILSLLLKEGFIRGFFINHKGSKRDITVLLKYVFDKSLFRINLINSNQIRCKLNQSSYNFNYLCCFKEKDVILWMKPNKRIFHDVFLLQVVAN